ncbi:TonB-dependent receptor [Dyadobacter crusticola]|uniref:TonB-dependent receptor n=1 Tax=Dyadobacter crusticola TaxID=292407 RepID=UPI000691F7DA|nr:TonB-dependent receptor [Dyadobacter crusticola]
MKIFITEPNGLGKGALRRLFHNPDLQFVMRVSFCYLLLLVLSMELLLAGPVRSQKLEDIRVTLELRNEKLKSVFDKIEKQTRLNFAYNELDIASYRSVNLVKGSYKVSEALDLTLKATPFAYKQLDKSVIIYRAQPKQESALPESSALPAKVQQAIFKIAGKVTTASGSGIPGVNVVLKGTNIGTPTDVEGRYSLDLPDGNGTLVFSYIGYISQEIAVQSQSVLNVVLQENKQVLDEVVVVGYGTQRKGSMTGAVGTIKKENLLRRPVSNIQQALQGQLPGLTIVDNGGAPGKSNTTVRVRGVTTLSDNNPLIIVDGIEQRLADINPNDIESVSVLKDASSAAIYGSRAANGVILVTTVQGKSGKLAVNYHGYYALQRANNKPEHMALEPFMRMLNVGAVNAGVAPKYTEEYIQEYVNATDRLKYPLPNTWFNTLYSVAPQQNHSISVSGGNEGVRSRLSLRHQNQDAIVPNSGSKINEIRLNTDFKLSSKITLNTDINYRYTSFTSLVNDNNRYENIYNRMFHSSQWAVPKYPDGTYGLSAQGHNPLMYAEIAGVSKTNDDYIIGNFKGNWAITNDLMFSTQFAARFNNTMTKAFANKYEVRDYYNKDIVKKNVLINSLNEDRIFSREITINNLLTYSKEIGAHAFNVLVGYSQISNNGNNVNAFRQNFYNNNIQSISQGANDNTKNNGGADYQWGLRSFFGRVNYAYQDKYLLEVNSRYDGSSRFMQNRRYGYFPSMSVGWRVSNEQFWEKLSTYVNDFKLRGSWGKNGNQAVALYSYFPTLSLVNYTFDGVPASGYAQLNLADPDLTWETTTQTNLGLDAQLLSNKVSLTIDYYRKRTNKILLVLPVPGTLGLNPSARNAGVVDNNGWEFALGAQNKWNQFALDVNANLNINNNKVVSLAGTGPYISSDETDPIFIIGEGYPINSHWGYETDGLFQTQDEISKYPTLVAGTKPGDVKYVDLNGDGIINPSDRKYLGNSFPKYTFGMSLNMSYKQFSLDILLQGAAQVKTRLAGALAEMGNNEGFTHAIFTNNYWTPEHRDARFPRPLKSDLRNLSSSDRMMIDGSYLRMKNIQLVYQLPGKLTEKAFIQRMNVYVSGTNLLTFSKLNEWNLDPETISGRGAVYPQTSLYTLGVNLSF